MDQFFQFLFSGFVTGSQYALVALGFVIVIKVTGLVNFTQGEFVMLGGMFTSAMTRGNVPLELAVPLAVVAVGLIGVLQERLTFAPVRGRAAFGNIGLLTNFVIAFGLVFVFRGVVLLIWGRSPLSVPSFTDGSFGLLGARLQWQSAWVVGIALGMLILFYLFFRFTLTGKALRACADHPAAARMMGIRLGRMHMLAFFIAAVVGATAGAAMAPITFVTWDMGFIISFKGFVAALLAGLFSIPGAVAAGLSLGVLEALAAGYISSAWRDAITFIALLVFLFARLGSRESVKALLVRTRERSFRSMRSVGSPVSRGLERQRRPLSEFVPRFSVGGLREWRWLPLFVIVVAIFPLIANNIQIDLAIVAGILALGAIGLTLQIGYADLLNLGFPAWYLIGGYTSAVMTVEYGWDPFFGILLGMLLGTVAAVIVGVPILKLKGLHLAVATLGVLIIAQVTVARFDLTGNTVGVFGVPRLSFFGLDLSGRTEFLFVTWAVVALALVITLNIARSRTGRALRALTASEAAAGAMGVDQHRLRLWVFVVTGVLASIGGSLFAHHLRAVDPNTFGFPIALTIVSFAVIGGVTSVWGGAVGAVLVTIVEEMTRRVGLELGAADAAVYETIIVGVLLVLILMLYPAGVASAIGKVWQAIGGVLGRTGPAGMPLPAGARAGPGGMLSPPGRQSGVDADDDTGPAGPEGGGT